MTHFFWTIGPKDNFKSRDLRLKELSHSVTSFKSQFKKEATYTVLIVDGGVISIYCMDGEYPYHLRIFEAPKYYQRIYQLFDSFIDNLIKRFEKVDPRFQTPTAYRNTKYVGIFNYLIYLHESDLNLSNLYFVDNDTVCIKKFNISITEPMSCVKHDYTPGKSLVGSYLDMVEGEDAHRRLVFKHNDGILKLSGLSPKVLIYFVRKILPSLLSSPKLSKALENYEGAFGTTELMWGLLYYTGWLSEPLPSSLNQLCPPHLLRALTEYYTFKKTAFAAIRDNTHILHFVSNTNTSLYENLPAFVARSIGPVNERSFLEFFREEN